MKIRGVPPTILNARGHISDEQIIDALQGDGWAMVEMFRHQHGELPKPDDKRTIDVAIAAQAFAVSTYKGQVNPFNAAQLIAWLGREVQRLGDMNGTLVERIDDLKLHIRDCVKSYGEGDGHLKENLDRAAEAIE